MSCDTAPQAGGTGIGHHVNMPRSPAQSDFVVTAPPGDPGARDAHAAGARATRWVMTACFVMLALLALICAIGPHVPAGE